MPSFNADGLIAQAEAYGKRRFPGEDEHSARMRLAATVGAMSADIRNLCQLIELQRTATGVAEAVAVLPSKHHALLHVMKALHQRIEREAVTANDEGYDDAAEYLGDAVEAMDRAFARVLS